LEKVFIGILETKRVWTRDLVVISKTVPLLPTVPRTLVSSAGMAQLTTRHVCRVSCLTSSHRVCPMRRAMTVQMTAPRHRSHYPRAIRQEKKLPQTERVSLGAGLSSANHRTCQGHQTPVTLQPSGCRLDSPSISRRLMRKVATSRLSMACGMFQ